MRTIARIIVVSAAYLGDVAPFVEPANRLVERGHDVTYVVPPGYHQLLAGERFALACYPLDFSSAAMHADPEHERLMRRPILNILRLARYWLRKAYASAPDAVREALLEAFAGADAVVTHPTMAAVALPVARRLGVPVVVGQLFPMMVPDARWTFPVGDGLPTFRPRLNKALWDLYSLIAGPALYDRPLNALRRSLNQPPLRGNTLSAWMHADRTVMLVSRHYHAVEPPAGLPVTWGGFSHWAGPGRAPLDPEVEAYLDAGDPPVLVTLGTSAATNAGSRFAAMADGLEARGLRSLLLVGSRGNLAALAGRKGAFEFAPLAPALARCQAAVISGSLGTVGAALAAGVPVVVVPQIFDQVWNGERAEKLGVGVLVRRTEEVPAAVARVLADPGYAERARELARKMAGEDGAAALADTVESLVSCQVDREPTESLQDPRPATGPSHEEHP
ncbi:MAG TPA: glycosyltransferase [Acidimicrobiales bacterium]